MKVYLEQRSPLPKKHWWQFREYNTKYIPVMVLGSRVIDYGENGASVEWLVRASGGKIESVYKYKLYFPTK